MRWDNPADHSHLGLCRTRRTRRIVRTMRADDCRLMPVFWVCARAIRSRRRSTAWDANPLLRLLFTLAPLKAWLASQCRKPHGVTAMTDNSPGAFLRLRAVEHLTGWKKSSIYDAMNRSVDPFPRPFRLGERCVAWREKEVLAWMASRPRTGSAEAA